jgi:hypothetical protein
MAKHLFGFEEFTPADFGDLLFYTQQLEALLPEDQQKLIQPTAAELSSTGVKIEE